MSADAKIWQDDEGNWHGVHDGDCLLEFPHLETAYDLLQLIIDIEECANEGRRMRWEFRIYPDGKAGLIGYTH